MTTLQSLAAYRRPDKAARNAAWAASYRGGATMQDIADAYGVSLNAVYYVLHELGVEARPRGKRISEDQFRAKYADVLSFSTSGLSLDDIGKRFGVTGNRVQQIYQRAGIKRAPTVTKQFIRKQARLRAKAEASQAKRGAFISLCHSMAHAREQGLTFREVGELFGVSLPFAHSSILRVRPDLRTRTLPPRKAA